MDPLSIIASTIAVVRATASLYTAIQNLKGVPSEFSKVSRNLPLAEDTLLLVRNQLESWTLDEPSRTVLEPCHVENGVAKDRSALELYRTILLRFGKAHRPETLMKGILSGLDALAANQLFRMATQSSMTQLREAIDRLSEVVSSVADSDFEATKSFNHTVETGGAGYLADRQLDNPGSGQQYNVSGSGHTMNFGAK
ncbi:hypothetical protein QQS21_010058 [Conoideocrella luteorostrata]|uniref:NACHT-NTPase and P-loop NTPases N-terminal domain-containing protein n=1 Tax=Conoideocrella luteorostrata TaxID=1105319 RepID=A0AAJ0FPS7_9HYPO|nr:hypothetical protein QQS21_010058 [Conoideocrella luteorostrata]